MAVQVLLKHSAIVNAITSTKWTPLHPASVYGHPKIARVLLEHGADVNAKSVSGRTPLWLLSQNSGNLEVAQMLLEHGANPTWSVDGSDSLAMALAEGHRGLAQLLLKHGAVTNSRYADYGGRTPLQVALENGWTEVVQLLLEHGADAETHVRDPTLNDPGSLYDTIRADMMLRNDTH